MTVTTVLNPRTYTYYGDGLRASKTENGIQTKYVYLSGKVIEELDAANASKARNIWGNELVLRKDMSTGKSGYYHYNSHGDVVAISDGNGQELNNYAYDTWGNVISKTEGMSNPYQYSGEPYDEKTGFYYLRARYYDPKVGRFISEDTYKGAVDNPLSLNRYAYVENNPLAYIDPSGHCKAGKDSGCYVDSFSNADKYLDEYFQEIVSFNSQLWSGLEKEKNSMSGYWSSFYSSKQKELEAYNDQIRNNPNNYFSQCLGGCNADFIIQNGKAIGVQLNVPVQESSSNLSILDLVISTANAAELPASNIGKSQYGHIVHYYHGDDHAPPHVHVYDNKGHVVKVGQNGKPIEGEPELNRAQQNLVNQYRGEIRSSVSKIMKWYRITGGGTPRNINRR